ncbi:MAG: hypothetical protein ABSE63_18895 [Thermoguttaceae bacterium]|jgi:hypothetical protein
MVDPLRPNPFFDRLVDEHRQWLSGFDRRYLIKWNTLLNNDEEAALCEARVRQMLQSLSVQVQPNEDTKGDQGGPDYLCHRYEKRFYVEVKCITREVATHETGLVDGDCSARNPGTLNRLIFYACNKKAGQCSNQDAPVLLAVGTFHSNAAMHSFMPPWPDMLLTGKYTPTVILDKKTGASIGPTLCESELGLATFIKFTPDGQIDNARSSISGLLLCGLIFEPVMMVGVLHPNPVRPFDPSILPEISFGEVRVDHETGDLYVSWTREGSK